MAVTFIAVAVSGILMLAHIRNGGLHGLHQWAGVAMAVAGLVHLAVNWRAFLALFRYRRAIIAGGLATILSVALFAAGSGERQHGRRPGPPCPEAGSRTVAR